MKQFKVQVPQGYEIDKEKSTFENIVFKKQKDKYPNSWEELEIPKGYYIKPFSEVMQCGLSKVTKADKSIYPKKEQAESALLLSQLLQLRDHYRNGWIPDYSKPGKLKYTIEFRNNRPLKVRYYGEYRIFSFQSKEIRDIFYNNFKNELDAYFRGLL